MGEVVNLERGMLGEADATPRSMRQPGLAGAGCPVSQFVSIGTLARNLLERLERDMNEKAVTSP